MSKDYYVGIAEGDILNHVAWVKTGYNPAVGTTTEDMWYSSIPYVFPTSAIQMRVVSTSAQDGVGGTGALTVWVDYLDGNYAEKTTTVIMNGITDVNTTPTDIFRIQHFRVASVGNTGMAVGDITIRNISTATVYSSIEAGFSRARNIVFTVPAGKTLYVNQIAFAATGGKPVRFTTRATYDNVRALVLTPGIFFSAYNEVMLIDSTYTKDLIIPTKLPEKTDIKVSVVSLSGISGECTTTLSGWIEKN
jgi:hypothetical protein